MRSSTSLAADASPSVVLADKERRPSQFAALSPVTWVVAILVVTKAPQGRNVCFVLKELAGRLRKKLLIGRELQFHMPLAFREKIAEVVAPFSYGSIPEQREALLRPVSMMPKESPDWSVRPAEFRRRRAGVEWLLQEGYIPQKDRDIPGEDRKKREGEGLRMADDELFFVQERELDYPGVRLR